MVSQEHTNCFRDLQGTSSANQLGSRAPHHCRSLKPSTFSRLSGDLGGIRLEMQAGVIVLCHTILCTLCTDASCTPVRLLQVVKVL